VRDHHCVDLVIFWSTLRVNLRKNYIVSWVGMVVGQPLLDYEVKQSYNLFSLRQYVESWRNCVKLLVKF